jgi:hypothetical protein
MSWEMLSDDYVESPTDSIISKETKAYSFTALPLLTALISRSSCKAATGRKTAENKQWHFFISRQRHLILVG